MSESIKQLIKLKQSLWYDNIQRRLLENGELAAMIARGDIRGVTSNPTIFHNAIAKSNDYDAALMPLAWSGWTAEEIFWQLAIEDITAACDLFLPLYEESQGEDGYVSLEVNPLLAHDTEGTLAQARHLWQTVNRPNLMIKIPATKAGIPAVRAAIAEGINVNVTLIFSLERYHEVMDAYLSGLEDRVAAGLPIANIASVASFFVSRVDTKVDAQLPSDSPLRGQAAIANAKLAYEAFESVFTSKRFHALHVNYFAKVQRPLWASTSTKNPNYPDTIYVDNLIGPSTVNTVPPQTLEAFRDHGVAAVTITRDVEQARAVVQALAQQGILMARVTEELEVEGVKAFADAFTALLDTLEARRAQAAAQLGPLASSVGQRVAHLAQIRAAERLYAIDPSLWTDNPAGQAEIKIRLGWLTLPHTSRHMLPDLATFVDQVRAQGFKRALLLGMGGSSLAPEVMSLIFAPHGLTFGILDSTDPAQVLETAAKFPVEETLFIVASKSGGTAEVSAMFDYFWAEAREKLSEQAAKHFIAITDPGTALDKDAAARGFLKIFHADPTVGGRYSVLTAFGLVPAALMGIDPAQLLDRAAWMSAQCQPHLPPARNPGLVLGAIIGQAALDGRDKLTLLADSFTAPLGAWLEQLIAESSGKQGKGIVVVDGEPLAAPETYSPDRLFVYLRHDGARDALVTALRAAGHPVLTFDIPEAYTLAAEFYRWEVATAIACAVLGVNAFDQPDVQDNKNRTKAKIEAYAREKQMQESVPLWQADGVSVFSTLALQASDAPAFLTRFLAAAKPGDYIALNAYLRRNPAMESLLQELRALMLARTGCATTLGFGPRFLHSTGQLHKGGADNGIFVQITADPQDDVSIPGQDMSFGILQRAQALGDYEALAARGRRILRLHFSEPGRLQAFVEAFK